MLDPHGHKHTKKQACYYSHNSMLAPAHHLLTILFDQPPDVFSIYYSLTL